MAWTYSDWITLDEGSTARLAQLRLHIKEVSDKISGGSYTTEGKSHDFDSVQKYLDRLLALEKDEAAAAGAATGDQTVFVRVVPIRPGETGP